MKPASIEKVNGLGTAGYIIATIAKALMIIALVLLLIATIVMFIIPADLLDFNVTAAADIRVDCGALGITADQLNPDELNAALNGENAVGTLSIQGMDLLFSGFSVSGDTVTVSASGSTNLFSIGIIRILLIAAFFVLAIYLVCTFFIANFCKVLSQCKSPFEEQVVRKMQQLAWAMLMLPLISSLTNSLAESAVSGNLSITLSIDLMEIIIILAMFALSYIFKYGAQLQQESDETL